MIFRQTTFLEGWAAILTIDGRLTGAGSAIEDAAIEPAQRRRLTPYGRVAFRCALGLTGRGGEAGLVFCSQHGDTNLTLELLQTQISGELLSPTGFSLSVHNAVAGLLDIGRRSHAGHVAISAGRHTLGAGLIEALLRLSERPELAQILLYVDLPLARGYPADAQTPDICGFALRMSAVRTDATIGEISHLGSTDGALDTGPTSRELVFMLADHMGSGTPGSGISWSSQGSQWKLELR